MFHRSQGPFKTQNHAQDGDAIAMKFADAAPGDLPWSSCSNGVHPPMVKRGICAFYSQLPDCCWTLCAGAFFENLNNVLTDHAKIAHERAGTEQYDEFMLFEQLRVTRLAFLLM